MKKRHAALFLVLRELGIPLEIETLDDRKKVQKGVFLGQAKGVDLGYNFGWYLMGPYSPELTKDYFEIAEALENGDRSTEEFDLHPEVKKKLQEIGPILTPPARNISQENWLEVLASIRFLNKEAGLNSDGVVEIMRTQKPHLQGYSAIAEQKLKSVGLL
jgi:uncharacterized protein YwgA